MERVMIVEDHSAFAQALELVLGQVDGTKVALARTLEEGRALIGSGKPFDLVLLDLTLPDGEGGTYSRDQAESPGDARRRPQRQGRRR